MSIDSHTQLPKQILQHFRDPESGLVWYLNLTDGRIHRTSSKKLGTITDYYSADMEQYLCKTVESDLGSFWSEIADFANGKVNSVTVHAAKETAVRQYVKALIARSDYWMKAFEEKSLTAALCTPQENHDDLVKALLGRNNKVNRYVEQLQVAYLSNQTDQYFVVPKNGYYCIKSKGHDHLIIPVSPKFAFILKSSEDVGYDKNGAVIHHYRIDDENDIYDFNLHALQFEYALNKDFVAGARKDELEALIPFLEKHRDELEEQRNKLAEG